MQGDEAVGVVMEWPPPTLADALYEHCIGHKRRGRFVLVDSHSAVIFEGATVTLTETSYEGEALSVERAALTFGCCVAGKP